MGWEFGPGSHGWDLSPRADSPLMIRHGARTHPHPYAAKLGLELNRKESVAGTVGVLRSPG